MAKKKVAKRYRGTYNCMVECSNCNFKDIATIPRTTAVKNAKCPECGKKTLERSN